MQIEGQRGRGALKVIPAHSARYQVGISNTAMYLQPPSVRKYDGISDAPGLNNFAESLLMLSQKSRHID